MKITPLPSTQPHTLDLISTVETGDGQVQPRFPTLQIREFEHVPRLQKWSELKPRLHGALIFPRGESEMPASQHIFPEDPVLHPGERLGSSDGLSVDALLRGEIGRAGPLGCFGPMPNKAFGSRRAVATALSLSVQSHTNMTHYDKD